LQLSTVTVEAVFEGSRDVFVRGAEPNRADLIEVVVVLVVEFEVERAQVLV
jgi:hypothetical protein